jgi:hypothetical protein
MVGSVFASVYSGRIGSASALAALPGDVRSTMEHSMAAAYKVVGHLPAQRVADVRDAVNHAVLDGIQVGSLVCAAIALVAAVVVAGLLPARTPIRNRVHRAGRVGAYRHVRNPYAPQRGLRHQLHQHVVRRQRRWVAYFTPPDGSPLGFG